ncbi:MAG: aminoglycoside phosphotransferase family protein [Alphaproteobacteria bacterium]|nr:aminoglycoside phosphotransferase family protein [Alphaproteobacteria bacterium]
MTGLLARVKARRALRAALAPLPETDGLTLDTCLKATDHALVYAGTLDDEEIVVKQARGELAEKLAFAQVEELRYQHPRMRDGPFRVPEVLIARPEAGLVVMTRAPGIRLDRAIRDAPGLRAAFVRQAGEWLAHYIAPRREPDTFGGGYWIKRRSEALSELPPGPDHRRIGALIERMRAVRTEFTGRLITRARCHGDFCPINLLVAGDEMWGVDIQNSSWLAVAKDLARFLVYLEIALPAGVHDGPWGLSGEDYEGLLAADGLLEPGEAEMVMPYFLAVELAGRLMSERHDAFMLSSARQFADRMNATPV